MADLAYSVPTIERSSMLMQEVGQGMDVSHHLDG